MAHGANGTRRIHGEFGGMWHGSATDIAVQREIDADRKWIDSHPNVVAHGRAVLIFQAHERTAEELRVFVERFRRVFFYMNPDAVAPYMEQVRETGSNLLRTITLRGGREHLERCRELSTPIDSKVPGAELLLLDEGSPDALILGVQEFYCSVGLIPQPASFVRGYDGTAVTVAAIDENGRVIGTASVQHLRRAGSEFACVGYSSNTGILPQNRIAGLGRLVNATAVVEAARRFGVDEIWANTGLENEAAIAYHSAVHRYVHPDFANFWAERPI
jgi:hypothetical protein